MKLVFPLLAASANASLLSGADQIQLGPEPEAIETFLIETAPGVSRWITEEQKWELKREGVNFMDITDGSPGTSRSPSALAQTSEKKAVKYPTKLQKKDTAKHLIRALDKDHMYQNLQTFSSFHTRYYKSDFGAQSSAWLLDQIKQTVDKSGASKHGAKVEAFTHPWGQNSVIATIPGRSNRTIVAGAHQDSINLFLPSILAAPGADDDGSGTVTILEALGALLQDDAIVHGNASNTIEFHWYSAEEGGLLGSQAIFKKYEAEGRDVKAMLHQDMTGYISGTIKSGKSDGIGIIVDFVDSALTAFIKTVVKGYCTIPYVETKCGYACSDHASASKAGYPSACAIESEFKNSNKKIHTTLDTIDNLDFDHMLQHARLTLGYTYELAFADL